MPLPKIEVALKLNKMFYRGLWKSISHTVMAEPVRIFWH